MTRSRRSADAVRVLTAPPDPRTAVPLERDVSTGRLIELDHDDKQRSRDQRTDRSGPRRTTSPSRQRAAIPAPRLPSIRSASSRGVLAGGALLAVVVVVVGAVVLLSSGTPTPVDTADAVPETVASSVIATGSATGSPAPVGALPVTTGSVGPVGTQVSITSAGTVSVPPVPGLTSVGAPAPVSSVPVSTRPTSTIPPALDPTRIWGYRAVYTVTATENAGEFVKVGDMSEYLVRCIDGTCASDFDTFSLTFAAALDRISTTYRHTGPGQRADSPCMPVTTKFTLVRQADGSYRGTSSSTPRAIRASRGAYFCSWFSTRGTNVLTPILLPVIDDSAANGPATLDPARITGYTGSTTFAGKKYPVTVACDRGLCSLPCPLVGCAGHTVLFTAAAATVDSGSIALGSSCKDGTGSVTLQRDASGGYMVRSTSSTEGAPANCTEDKQFRLTPTID